MPGGGRGRARHAVTQVSGVSVGGRMKEKEKRAAPFRLGTFLEFTR